MSERSWLRPSTIAELEPLGAVWGVSEVARSARGFLPQWIAAKGHPDRLDPWWRARRNAFLARHLAQITTRKEDLWANTPKGRFPTPRHLALIFWAHTPDARGVAAFLKRWKGEIPGRPSGR